MGDKAVGTKEVAEMSADILEAMGDYLATDCEDVEWALEKALAEVLAPVGGVVLVWWDPVQGLRMNPAKYPVVSINDTP